jgi:hypothetical protein
MHIHILIAIWFAGAITAGIALLIPMYNNYVIVGTIGWGIVCTSTALILNEIKRMKAEDKKEEMA